MNSDVNKTKKKKSNIKQEFIHQYVHSSLKNKDKKVPFLNTLFDSKDQIPDDCKHGMKLLTMLDKYKDFDADKEVSLQDLQKAALWERAKIHTKKNSIEQKVSQECELTQDQILQLWKHIDNCNEKELDILWESHTQRLDFVKKNIKKDIETKIFLTFLEEIDIRNQYRNFNTEQKEALSYFYDEKYEPKTKINEMDVYALFESWIFSADQKLKILQFLIPSIDWGKAKSLWLIDDAFLEKQKKQYLKKEFWDWLEESVEKKLLAAIKPKDIYVPTKDLHILWENVDFLIENISLDPIVESYNDSMKRVIEEQWRVENFSEILKQKGITNFAPGNIIRIETEDTSTGQIHINYYQIAQTSDERSQIKLIEESSNNRYQKSWKKEHTVSQRGIIDLIENKIATPQESKTSEKKNEKSWSNSLLNVKNFACYDSQDFWSYLRDEQNKEFLEDTNEIELLWEDEIGQKKQQAENELKKQILTEQWKKEEEITPEDIDNFPLYSDDDSAQEDYDKRLQEKYNEIDNINFGILKNKIDELDPEWAVFWFWKDVTFEMPSKDGKICCYTIANYEGQSRWKKGQSRWKKWYIDVRSAVWNKFEISFRDFFEGWKKEKPKRTSKVNHETDLFGNIGTYPNIWEVWSKFEFKENGIYKKEGKKDAKYEYDFLVSQNSKELVKIHSIDGNRAKISFWDVKQEKKWKDGKIHTSFWVSQSVEDVSIWFLDTWIRKHSLIPRSLDEEKDVKEEADTTEKRKGSFCSRLFDRLSVADMIAWGKLYIDYIEKFLKEWQDELAARFANSLWLPEEVKADLRAREEAAKKKRMDDYIEKLKWIDSGPATKMIFTWLKNKNSSEPKKEASLMFMMEKYGVLYAKSGLAHYSGSFLWYEALWGKKRDTLYKEVQKQQADKDQAFTEEELVYILLIKQCKPGWYNGISRRSRLHKEFKKFRNSGKQDEFSAWEWDAKDISRCDDIVEFSTNEALWWTYPNAIWSLHEAVDRWGSIKMMNQVPFMLLFSWVAYSMEEASRDLLRKMPGGGRILPITSFMRFQSSMDLINNVILKLCYRIEAKWWGKYNGMSSKAQEIFDDMHKTGGNYTNEKKMKKCLAFYNKYGEVIMEALYGLNSRNNTSDSYINDIIYLEKDDYVDEYGNKHSWEPIFKQYYEKCQIEASQYSYKEEYMSDAFKYAGMSWFEPLKTMKFALSVNSNGSFINKDSSGPLLDEMIYKVDTIKNSAHLTDVQKHKLLVKNLKWVIAAIVGSSVDGFMKSTQILTFLRKLWINLKEIKELGTTEQDIMNCENGSKEYDLLSLYVKNILQREDHRETKDESDFDIFENVKRDTDNIMSS